jgi:hypothetical protein
LAQSPTIAGTVSVAAGSAKIVSGLPTGYVCTVTETLPSEPAGYTWSTPAITGSPTAALTKGVTASVTVANGLNVIPPPVVPPVQPIVAIVTPEPATSPDPVVTPTPTPAPTPVVFPEPGTGPPTSVNAGGGSTSQHSNAQRVHLALLIAVALGAAAIRLSLTRRNSE